MTTLANRATPRQAVVMRMIAGAVRNAGHAHPEWGLNDRIARSIAKRAAGTVSAGWPALLAVSQTPSDRADGKMFVSPQPDAAARTASIARRGRGQLEALAGDASQALRRIPNRLTLALGAMAGDARRSGRVERYEALVEVLRMLAVPR